MQELVSDDALIDLHSLDLPAFEVVLESLQFALVNTHEQMGGLLVFSLDLDVKQFALVKGGAHSLELSLDHVLEFDVNHGLVYKYKAPLQREQKSLRGFHVAFDPLLLLSAFVSASRHYDVHLHHRLKDLREDVVLSAGVFLLDVFSVDLFELLVAFIEGELVLHVLMEFHHEVRVGGVTLSDRLL